MTHPLLVDGQFGAYMQVNIQNDGPVTITLDSPPHNQVGQSITCVTQHVSFMSFTVFPADVVF